MVIDGLPPRVEANATSYAHRLKRRRHRELLEKLGVGLLAIAMCATALFVLGSALKMQAVVRADAIAADEV